jgi:hypothetical protein
MAVFHQGIRLSGVGAGRQPNHAQNTQFWAVGVEWFFNLVLVCLFVCSRRFSNPIRAPALEPRASASIIGDRSFWKRFLLASCCVCRPQGLESCWMCVCCFLLEMQRASGSVGVASMRGCNKFRIQLTVPFVWKTGYVTPYRLIL